MKARILLAGALLSCVPIVAFAQDTKELPPAALPAPVAPPHPDAAPAPVPVEVEAQRLAVEEAGADVARIQRDLDEQARRLSVLQIQGQEKGTYLGISTSPAGPALQKQLKLPVGMGLVVDFVEDGSPAKAAGLAQFDVLRMVNDQLLVNSEQLQVLIRSYNAGDEIKLTVLREGKPQELVAKLIEKQVGALWQNGLESRRPVSIIAPRIDVKPNWGGDPFRGQAQIVLAQPNGGETVNWDDDEHHLELRRPAKGDPFLVISRHGDKEGEVLFQGPMRNEKDLKKLPPNLRSKFEMLERKLDKLEFPAGKGEQNAQDMVITRRDGERRLQLRDIDGNVTFEAPIETPEQREKLPPHVKRLLLGFSGDGKEAPSPKPTPKR